MSDLCHERALFFLFLIATYYFLVYVTLTPDKLDRGVHLYTILRIKRIKDYGI
jgi:hypothetical protein